VSDNKKSFYCAFCKTPRRSNLKRSVTLVEVSFCLVGSVLLSFLFWQKFDFKIFALFAILVCILEFFCQLKWRVSIMCSQCGFDPVLYLKDKDKAVLKIKAHLEKRKQDPRILLSKNPKLNLPIMNKSAGQKRESEKRAQVAQVAKKGKKLDLSL
jgi:hypothetical protein